MESNSRQLVTAASAGRKAAVESLLARHLPGLRAFVRLNAGPALRRREQSSDLVQSVCREVLENLGDFEYRGEAAFKFWLYQTARRKIVDRARYWKSAKRAADREVAPRRASSSGESDAAPLLQAYASFCTPSQEAILHEEEARIEKAFARLRPEDRRVITLARVVGLPHKEIAEILKKKENAVRQMLFRALAQLALHLDASAPKEKRAQ